jgi:nitroimidazol reductase NimA-like FMN-containing flavoprotein (pyridoxamine 5'-phosphate oxidase superfamily)
MNFGFVWDERLKLFMHSAREGKKLDMMRRNNRVCFQLDIDHQLVIDELSCRWSMNYASIVGKGTLVEVTDEKERFAGLECIMANYGKKGKNKFAAESLQATTVLRLDVDELTAKRKSE